MPLSCIPTTVFPLGSPNTNELVSLLKIMLHGHKCRENERENQECQVRGESLRNPPCALSLCIPSQNLLYHMHHCNLGAACKYNNCAVARLLIAHRRDCRKQECGVCMATFTEDEYSSVDFPDIPSPRNDPNWREYLTPTTRAINVGGVATRLPPNPSVSVMHPRLISSTIGVARQMETNIFNTSDSREAYCVRIDTLLLGKEPVWAKDWQNQIDYTEREGYIIKILKSAINPRQVSSEDQMANSLKYAKYTERQIFTEANCYDEYIAGLQAKVQQMDMERQEAMEPIESNEEDRQFISL